MGYYIKGVGDQRAFLGEHGHKITEDEAVLSPTHLPVCVADFTVYLAAIICHDEKELLRVKTTNKVRTVSTEWFLVPIETVQRFLPSFSAQSSPERANATSYIVTREDEHGTPVDIERFSTEAEAEALRAKLTTRGHKQFYQIRIE